VNRIVRSTVIGGAAGVAYFLATCVFVTVVNRLGAPPNGFLSLGDLLFVLFNFPAVGIYVLFCPSGDPCPDAYFYGVPLGVDLVIGAMLVCGWTWSAGD
jgi:hypothetical protein